ncbi:MAG TPA: bifunctional UDP-N-acetylglucosamine diphosphorylase/glucosamine-1-phosphate N-acetyltransferase GlmU, partial [Clostridiaceae bacterium]|nr:bifunctional UDP-N-acetylglucosamine diphosphorylase/glucosamine-1-phosphate N-acetyltransferase GlmU [Clostridiaceae bacterium]HBN27966.1 bifunctional UDP-N-acetylglucosamine diphosphorylase/glucosamine-1-phosphate N-acetyltransferase GlmU [Clostridiaceae bacterium]HCL50594.1 bifunctional UDP-N-acetylglucosamine diphosphorylase/glucosamine-1-phosphate N-acetyltransferase GlmU [Clostridiaceae bacterium]
GFAATILSAKVDDALGFGRIIRKNNEVVKIVEDKDADGEEKAVKEVNSAIYCFEIKALLNALDKIKNNNKQGEYYLTDAIEIMKNDGLKVGAYLTNYNELMGTNSEKCEVPAVFMGVNSRFQLAQAEKILREKILIRHMDEGVTILDPNTTYIDDEVKIGMDTVIYPNTIIEG